MRCVFTLRLRAIFVAASFVNITVMDLFSAVTFSIEKRSTAKLLAQTTKTLVT